MAEECPSSIKNIIVYDKLSPKSVENKKRNVTAAAGCSTKPQKPAPPLIEKSSIELEKCKQSSTIASFADLSLSNDPNTSDFRKENLPILIEITKTEETNQDKELGSSIKISLDKIAEVTASEQQREHEKVSSYLETPIIDESSVTLPVNEYVEKVAVHPKRLSDDFLSDENDDESKSEDTISETTNKSKKCNTTFSCGIVSGIGQQPNRKLFVDDSSFLEDHKNALLPCFSFLKADESRLDDSVLYRKDRVSSRASGSSGDNSNENLEFCSKVVISQNNSEENTQYEDDDVDNIHDAEASNADNSPILQLMEDNDVQSMDAIERKDFEHEQRLIGGVILKTSSLSSDNKFNLELLGAYSGKERKSKGRSSSENKTSTQRDQTVTPTSSRCPTTRLTKSTAKLNLSATLDRASCSAAGACRKSPSERTKQKQQNEKQRLGSKNRNILCVADHSEQQPSTSSSSSSSTASKSTAEGLSSKQADAFLNTNSNDSLGSDKSYNTSSSHSLPNYLKKSNSGEIFYNRRFDGEILSASASKNSSVASSALDKSDVVNFVSDDLDGASTSNPTSSTSQKCLYANFCCQESARAAARDASSSSSSTAACPSREALSGVSLFAADRKQSSSSATATSTKQSRNYETILQKTRASTSRQQLEEHLIEQSQIIVPSTDQTENDFDDENWADCEEGSDEEVCTCYNNANEYSNTSYFEDELPSRDVDLSGYIQLVTISEDMFLHDNPVSTSTTETTPHAIQRKRKFTDRTMDTDMQYGVSGGGGTETTPTCSRKRVALEQKIASPRNQQGVPTTPSASLVIGSPSNCFERRTPRSLIPTKDNPPPELADWLIQFQRWSHAERILAVDRLIENCEPTQVRHMMKVIEPQFQRDFISLLPKEVALQVLSYLDPVDLLRAAQTCRSWRFLCDDNLLWKEKCKQAQIVIEPNTDRPKRGRAGNMPPISSPWKAAYMRQHIIEMNWRSRPIREPKVLKGHDDHVITCLQFCGNRIVSGSDDNTLKVWSAITGKCLRTLVGHTGGVWSSQMSGNIIISGSTDRTLKVWNVETGQCIHTLLGHTSTVRCMHLHGKKVVSGSRDATLRVWDVEQGTCLHILVGHLAAVRCVQYDGKIIVSGAYDYMVKVWNPERQECLHTLQGHTNRVYSLQFDGIHVVSGSLDTSIRVWDAETGSCKHTLMGHQSLTSGMELRQNILVSGNADSTVKVWDITTGQCLQTLSGPNKHQSAVTCLQFNSRFVITSSDDGTVKLWDVKTGEFIRNLVALESGGSGGVVWRIRANDTKLICAVGSRNGTEETKLMVLDFDVEGACLKCS